MNKKGHIFLTWKSDAIYFTRAELPRLHLHFVPPSSDNCFNLIRRACPLQAGRSIRDIPQDIYGCCDSCKQFRPASPCLKASIPPEQLLFNHELGFDWMWLKGVPIMHIADTHTGLQNAAVLRERLPHEIWFTFVECWATIYTGNRTIIRLDQESSFVGRALRNLATSHRINLRLSGRSHIIRWV